MMEILQKLPLKADKTFKKLEGITDIASLSKEEQIMHEECIKSYRNYLETKGYAIEELEIDWEQGFAQGWKEGFEEGWKQGYAQGCREAKIESSRNMKADGLPVDLIAECTGLTAEEIEVIGLE